MSFIYKHTCVMEDRTIEISYSDIEGDLCLVKECLWCKQKYTIALAVTENISYSELQDPLKWEED